MTDASGGFHGPLTQKRDDKDHSGVTAEDESLPGRKDQSIKLSEIGGERRLFHGGFASRLRFQQQPGGFGGVTALRISEDLLEKKGFPSPPDEPPPPRTHTRSRQRGPSQMLPCVAPNRAPLRPYRELKTNKSLSPFIACK